MVIEVIDVINFNIGELGKLIYVYYKNCCINVDDIGVNGCLKVMLRLVDKYLN